MKDSYWNYFQCARFHKDMVQSLYWSNAIQSDTALIFNFIPRVGPATFIVRVPDKKIISLFSQFFRFCNKLYGLIGKVSFLYTGFYCTVTYTTRNVCYGTLANGKIPYYQLQSHVPHQKRTCSQHQHFCDSLSVGMSNLNILPYLTSVI